MHMLAAIAGLKTRNPAEEVLPLFCSSPVLNIYVEILHFQAEKNYLLYFEKLLLLRDSRNTGIVVSS